MQRRPARSQRLFLALLLAFITLPAVLLHPGPVPASAHAALVDAPSSDLADQGDQATQANQVAEQQSGSVGLVREALLAIERNYYDPVSGADLLDAAWNGAVMAGWAADDAEVPARPDLSGSPADAYDRFAAAYTQLEGRGLVSPTELAYAAIRGMVGFINNCHTYFLPPSQAASQRALASGQDLTGAGLIRTRVYPWMITYVAPGGGAAGAGLQVGDSILAYDGDRSADAPMMHVKHEGETLVYTIQHPGEPVHDVPVLIGRYRLPHLESRILAGNIGYLRFFSWESGNAQVDAIREALAGFEQQGVKGWILDVRANGGGFFTPIARLFMPGGTILREVPRGGKTLTVSADGSAVAPLRPLAVLIGPGSGSASEIIPEALRESGRAELIGEHTPGCMAGTAEVRLSDGSSLWVTAVHVLVGESGRDFEGAGVAPDIIAPLTPDDLAAGRDPGLDAAIRYLRGLTGGREPIGLDSGPQHLSGGEGSTAAPVQTPS